jgi:antitoxin CptB
MTVPDRRKRLLYIRARTQDGRPSGAFACLQESALTESSISSAGLDERRRRNLFRAWHRGMREMDILYGKFADAKIATLSDTELDQFEILMDLPDRDVLMFVTGESETPERYDTGLFRKLKDFHTHDGPIFG